MVTTKKTYSVGKVKQLIDLNGDSVNFNTTFKVTSHNNQPFDLVVVDQTHLDNTQNLEYKNVDNGHISGSVKQDKNVYQNYFLVLKADNPCECDVEINKEDLVPTPQQVEKPVQLQQTPPKKDDGYNWVKIFLVLGGLVCVGLIIYWLYRKKNSSNLDLVQPDIQLVQQTEVSNVPSQSPRHSSYEEESTKGGDNQLLAKLKNLRLS
jgi:hypothetical protein